MSPRAAVIWSQQAVDDLGAIHAYIARTSPHYAAVVASRLIDAVAQLAEFPRSGRIVPEADDAAIREVLHGAYRIVYELRGPDTVEILTVFHGARLFPGIQR